MPDISIFLDPHSEDTATFSPLLPPEELADEPEISPIERSLAHFKFHSQHQEEDLSPLSPNKTNELRQGRQTTIVRKRSVSVPTVDGKPFEYQKIRSESICSYEHRQLRRRPLIIDDQSSLNRLTTLFESQSLEEVESLVNSPVTPDGLEMFKPSNLSISQRLNQIPPNTAHRSSHSHSHSVQSKKSFPELHNTPHEIRSQPDGSVMAGTLHALVEKVTTDLESEPDITYFIPRLIFWPY